MGKICIYCQIKNEHLYLKEWLDYHFNLGFDKIYLMEDFDSLSHSAITAEYGNKVELHKIEEYFSEKELIAYASQRETSKLFINSHFGDKSDIDWCAFIDADEFIELESGYTLQSLVNEFTEYPGFYMYWKCYGANGHIKREKGTLGELYKAENNIYENYAQSKYFLNFKYPVQYEYMSMHIFPYCVKTDKTYIIDFPGVTYEKAWINHYFTKSWEDWKLRLMRGNMTKGLRRARDFFKYNPDLNDYKDELLKEVENMQFSSDKINLIDIEYSDKNDYNFKAEYLNLDNSRIPRRFRGVFSSFEEYIELFGENSINEGSEHRSEKDSIKNLLENWDVNENSHLCILYDEGLIMPEGFDECINKIINTFPKNMIFFGETRGEYSEDEVYLDTTQMPRMPIKSVGCIIPGIYKEDMLKFLDICPKYNDVEPYEYAYFLAYTENFFTMYASVTSPFRIIPHPIPLISYDCPYRLTGNKFLESNEVVPEYKIILKGTNKKK